MMLPTKYICYYFFAEVLWNLNVILEPFFVPNPWPLPSLLLDNEDVFPFG